MRCGLQVAHQPAGEHAQCARHLPVAVCCCTVARCTTVGHRPGPFPQHVVRSTRSSSPCEADNQYSACSHRQRYTRDTGLEKRSETAHQHSGLVDCRSEADNALAQCTFQGAAAAEALYLRAAIATTAGRDGRAAKQLLRQCFDTSAAAHGGAWLLLSCVLAQQGDVKGVRRQHLHYSDDVWSLQLLNVALQ